jgi:hypothetical protein
MAREETHLSNVNHDKVFLLEPPPCKIKGLQKKFMGFQSRVSQFQEFWDFQLFKSPMTI